MSKTKPEIIEDLTQLARIALTGRTQDVQALLYRIAKRHREDIPTLAASLTDLLREAPTRASPLRKHSEMAVPVDLDSRLHLLRIEDIPLLEHELILNKSVENSLQQIIQERAQTRELINAGIKPTKSIIFTGPPGVGKTMAARWLALKLQRPLLILDLAAVMSSYLGRTGSNLRHVLDYAKSMDCVLLLDELDAIAKKRDDGAEVGELKRLVTVLIQQIDDWPSSGILVAATNHPDLLDPAIWRRFEMTIEYPLPEREEIERMVNMLLSKQMMNHEVWAKVLSIAFQGKSYSDIERMLSNARRSSVVTKTDLKDILTNLINIDGISKQDRAALASTLVTKKILSQRKAQELTGVARETIRNLTTTEAQ